MKRYEFNKLIRNKLPKKMIEEGVIINGLELDHEQYVLKLKEKLLEEALEVQEASDTENIKIEVADVLEVVKALMKAYDITETEIEEARLLKASVNGVFDSNCFINYIEVDEDNKVVIDYMENKQRPYKLVC